MTTEHDDRIIKAAQRLRTATATKKRTALDVLKAEEALGRHEAAVATAQASHDFSVRAEQNAREKLYEVCLADAIEVAP